MIISVGSLPHIIGACLFVICAVRVTLQPVGLNTQKANRYIITLFLIFGAMLIDEFFVSNSVVDELFIGSNILLTACNLLLGPLTYCYISAMLVENSSFYKKSLHFIPFILFFVISILSEMFFTGQYDQILQQCFILLYLATLLPYILFSLRAIRSYLGDAKAVVSNLEHHNLSWARGWVFFMLGIALYVTFWPAVQLIISPVGNDFNIHYVVTLASVFLLIYPDTSVQLSLADSSAATAENEQDKTGCEDIVEPYLKDLYRDLSAQMDDKKYYLTNGLTLTDISQYLGVTTHEVSAALNKVGAVCFYDYVNNFRIEQAKRLLIDYPARAIIDIAMEAGFNSKSAFYNAFSKRETLSPSQYRKETLLISK